MHLQNMYLYIFVSPSEKPFSEHLIDEKWCQRLFRYFAFGNGHIYEDECIYLLN